MINVCVIISLDKDRRSDKSTKKSFPMFSLTSIQYIVFCKYEPILILMAATHPKNIGTETK